MHEVSIDVSLFQETCSAPKNPGCAPVTFNLAFHPNFHPNILVFAILPIYRKIIHDNIHVLKTKNLLFSILKIPMWAYNLMVNNIVRGKYIFVENKIEIVFSNNIF